MQTSRELWSAGFEPVSWRPFRTGAFEVWVNAVGARVCRFVAPESAGRGHWKWNPVAAWWRWHFGR